MPSSTRGAGARSLSAVAPADASFVGIADAAGLDALSSLLGAGPQAAKANRSKADEAPPVIMVFKAPTPRNAPLLGPRDGKWQVLDQEMPTRHIDALLQQHSEKFATQDATLLSESNTRARN